MVDRGKLLALAVAGCVAALNLMQPPALVTVPLLLASLFLVAWAIVPDVVRGWARRTGSAAPYLLSALDRLDALLARIVGEHPQDRGCVNRLADKIVEGSALLNHRTSKEELDAWLTSYEKWTNDVSSEIERNFGKAQAIAFRNIGAVKSGILLPYCNKLQNRKKLRLQRRLENLTEFVKENSRTKT